MQSFDVTISLSDLQSLPDPLSPLSINPFAAYLVNPRNSEHIELISKDSHELPMKPLRRQACPKCLTERISCKDCSECHGQNKACCRGLACLYDYDAYNVNREAQPYRTCPCMNGYIPSRDDFQIDWRLLALIHKLPDIKSVMHKFYLNHAGGALWISKELPGDDQDNPRETFHEDNFGVVSFHERTIRDPNTSTLVQSNTRNLTNLLSKNIRRYLTTKEGWEVSNLQEECQEVADVFFSNKKMEAIKWNLQNTTDNSFASGPSLKFQGKFTQIFVSNSKKVPEYRDCSDFQNADLIFNYCYRSQLLFIRNAKFYQKQEQYSNLRAIRIHWHGAAIGPQGVWFRDRKGDIFAISKGVLYIFKFHLPSKAFQQFTIDKHYLLSLIDSPSALLYIPHKDTVYCFTPKQLKKSFYFTLYRPKGQDAKGVKAKNMALSKHSCTSVTFYPDFLMEKEKSFPKGGVPACRAIYVMQDFKFKGRNQRRELVPVIYLLCERRGYLPLGIGIYRMVHHQDILQAFAELPAVSPQTQSNSQESIRDLSFGSGIHFVLSIEKTLRLCYFAILDRTATLITAKIVPTSEGKDGICWEEQPLNLNGCFQPKILPQGVKQPWKVQEYMVFTEPYDPRDQKNHSLTPLLVSDLQGVPASNQIKFLAENYKTGRVVDIVMSLVEGVPQWRIFEL